MLFMKRIPATRTKDKQGYGSGGRSYNSYWGREAARTADKGTWRILVHWRIALTRTEVMRSANGVVRAKVSDGIEHRSLANSRSIAVNSYRWPMVSDSKEPVLLLAVVSETWRCLLDGTVREVIVWSLSRPSLRLPVARHHPKPHTPVSR